MVESVLSTCVCMVIVRVKLPSASAPNSSNRPPSCESHVWPFGSTPAWHCANPSVAFGVKPEPWTTTCWPSVYGPAGSVESSGGGATAVGSKPSGTSLITSGSSIDWTRTTHSPTTSAEFAVSRTMMTPPSEYVRVRCTRIEVSTSPLASADWMFSGPPFVHEIPYVGASASHCETTTRSPGAKPVLCTWTTARSGTSNWGSTDTFGTLIGTDGSKSMGVAALSPPSYENALTEHFCGALAQSTTLGG